MFYCVLFTSNYNIYTDPNVTEVTKCYPILDALIQSVNALLEQWPDHPILNQVISHIASWHTTVVVYLYLRTTIVIIILSFYAHIIDKGISHQGPFSFN